MSASIKQNAWGNWYGYLGRKKVESFMNSPTQSQEQAAKEWLEEQQQREALAAMWQQKPIEI